MKLSDCADLVYEVLGDRVESITRQHNRIVVKLNRPTTLGMVVGEMHSFYISQSFLDKAGLEGVEEKLRKVERC